MPAQPGLYNVHVDRPLTNISIAFIQNSADFVAASAFPNIPVSFKSDLYYIIPRGAFNRDEMEERAPGTESAGGGFDTTTDSYLARVYAYHKDVADQVRRNQDNPLNLDRSATTFVTLKALIKREKLWVSKYFVGGIWTFDYDGVAAAPGANQVLQWNDASSTPIENVRFAKRSIRQITGLEPNTLVMGREVWDTLMDHPDIIDRVKYGQTAGRPAMADLNILAQLFEVERILVMNAIENTAAEGATDVHVFIGGKKALLCYAAPVPGIMEPSAGYTFSWTGLNPGFAGDQGNAISRFRMDPIRSDRVEIEMAFDQKLVAADLGFFWDTIVA